MSKILNLQLENSRLARPFKTNLVHHQYTNFALFRTLTISSLLAENFQLIMMIIIFSFITCLIFTFTDYNFFFGVLFCFIFLVLILTRFFFCAGFKNLPVDGVFVSLVDVGNLASPGHVVTRVVISGGGGGGSNIRVVHMAHL